ncbi:DUF1456 family protein [Halieaceae bacterium IMCC14734]|uniref:DUF1456 family protein n=1 Tax=Candidatus Litorirhabdus singularis TaxID=2518993 RepID=A0ABT3TGU1_9GAMM|nr:DUF1456 family protein [Candidatus Litorirhabdus singularis]MCX2980612.1 DUF1456 family protein [Candidatus Litorirhabdus singularis]
MENNDVLQAIYSALALSEEDIIALLEHGGLAPMPASPAGLLSACSNEQLRAFLEGLILAERGPRSDGAQPTIDDQKMSNNEVLKKLRIAFNLQQEDMLLILEEGGATLSASELGALFRKPGNKHFRECSDEQLLQFIGGFQPKLDT